MSSTHLYIYIIQQFHEFASIFVLWGNLRLEQLLRSIKYKGFLYMLLKFYTLLQKNAILIHMLRTDPI